MKKETAAKLLGLVKDNYQKIAAEFDATRKKEVWPEIRNLAVKVKEGDRILDVGCGNGRLLNALKDKKITYLGIDSSQELIAAAKQNFPEWPFQVGDALSLQAIDRSNFNYIFCLAVLQHIPSSELRLAALKEMKNKLAEDGQIIISVWNLWSRTWSQKNYRRLIIKDWLMSRFKSDRLDFGDIIFPWKNQRGEETSLRYYHAFTEHELKNLAERSGLKIISLKKDAFNYWIILK